MRFSCFSGAIVILITVIPTSVGADLGELRAVDKLHRGAALMRAERSAEAEAVLSSLGRDDAEYSTAQTLLGYMYLRRSSLDLAGQAFEKALASDPGNAAARFGLGVQLSRRAQLEEAARQFEQVFSDPSLGVKARSQWIQIRFWMGKDNEAHEEARKLALEFPSVAEYQSLLGFLSHVRGDVKGARLAFERALELDPGRLSDYCSLVSICRAQKDWKAALVWVRKAIALDPDQPLLYEELAGICDKLGLKADADAARSDSRRLMEAEVLYTRSVKAKAEGRPGESEDLLLRCVKANPQMSKAWADLGEVARANNRPDEALRRFERALEFNPSNRLARLGLASVLEERASTGQAAGARDIVARKNSPQGGAAAADTPSKEQDRAAVAAILLQAVREYPDNADLLAYLGRAQDESGNSQAAQETYTEALRIDPQQEEAILGKAGHLLRTGEAHRAIEEYRRATDIQPANIEAWRGLVRAHREAGDVSGAETACKECLGQNPADPDCLELLAYLKMDIADYRAAAELFETVLRDGRASKDLLDSQGFARMKIGEKSEAIGLFESSLKRYGADAWIYFNLGYLYQEQGNLPLAITNYRRARELSPQDPEVNHNLALALYLSKDYPAALELFKVAVRLKPDWGLAHFNLAMTYWHLGQYPLALAHARIAEQRDLPGASRVVQALTPGAPRSVTVYRKK